MQDIFEKASRQETTPYYFSHVNENTAPLFSLFLFIMVMLFVPHSAVPMQSHMQNDKLFNSGYIITYFYVCLYSFSIRISPLSLFLSTYEKIKMFVCQLNLLCCETQLASDFNTNYINSSQTQQTLTTLTQYTTHH